MAKFLNVADVADRINNMVVDNFDLSVTTPNLNCTIKDNERVITVSNFTEVDLNESGFDPIACTLNDHSYGQIREKLDLPPRQWLDNKCDNPLFANIFNYQAKTRVVRGKPKELLIRGYRDDDKDGNRTYKIRGVLSDKYVRYDNKLLIDTVLDITEKSKYDYQMANVRFDRDEFRGYVLMPDKGKDGDNGHGNGGGGGVGTIFPCVYLGNSEVGRSSVRILPGTLRLVCENGLIGGFKVQDSTRFIHLGKDEALFRANVLSHLNMAMGHATTMVSDHIAAYLKAVDNDMLDKTIEKWGKEWDLPSETQEQWKRNTVREARSRGSRTLTWGDILSGITIEHQQEASAVNVDTYDGMAGEMLRQLFGRPTWADVVKSIKPRRTRQYSYVARM